MNTKTVFISDDNESDEFEIEDYSDGDANDSIQIKLSLENQADFIYFPLHRDAAKTLLLKLANKLC